MLLQKIAKALGAELIEEQYSHILKHPEYQLDIAGLEKYGVGKFNPDVHERLEIKVEPRTTALGNREYSQGKMTASAKRPPAAIAKDIERRLVEDAKQFQLHFLEKATKDEQAKAEWEGLTSHLKAFRGEYFDAGQRVVTYRCKNEKQSYRCFEVTFDPTYLNYTLLVDTDLLTPFAQLADSNPLFRPYEITGFNCYTLKYSHMKSISDIYQLFNTYCTVFAISAQDAA